MLGAGRLKLKILKSAPLLVQKVEPWFRIISGGWGTVSVTVSVIAGEIQICLTTTVSLAFSLAWHSKSTTKDKILATTTNGINYNYYWIKSVSDKTKFKSKYSRVWDVCWFCLFAQNICGVKINSNDLINIFIPWFSRLARRAFSIIILTKKCWFWIMKILRYWSVSKNGLEFLRWLEN